jgi:hypothetical protein
METVLPWLALSALQCLPLAVVAALARWMHRSAAVVVFLMAIVLLVVADVWTYRHLADDALMGLYFVFVPGYLAIGVLTICLIDVVACRVTGTGGTHRTRRRRRAERRRTA